MRPDHEPDRFFAIRALPSRYHPAIITDPITIEFEPLDPDTVYRQLSGDVPACRRAGIEPVSRERAHEFVGELNEVLSGRPEPTTH